MEYGTLPSSDSVISLNLNSNSKVYSRIYVVLITVVVIVYISWLSLDIVGPWFKPTDDYIGSLSPNWHGFFMVLRFGVCYPFMLSLKASATKPKHQIIAYHLHLLAGVFSIIGVGLMIISKSQAGLNHFYGVSTSKSFHLKAHIHTRILEH